MAKRAEHKKKKLKIHETESETIALLISKTLWQNFKNIPFGKIFSKIWPYVILIIVIILASWMRFWGLSDRLHFDLDEAYQIQTIVDIYKIHTWPLQGPPASVGSVIYHGAFFYYLYLIPTLISKGNPIALAAFTILLSLASIPLLYLALKDQFSRLGALTATIIYSLATVVILYSRWSWNPNSIPFFFTLALFSLVKIKNNSWWLVIFAFCLGAISQLHVGNSFFTGIFVLMTPFLVFSVRKIHVWLAALAALILPWAPTLIFESSHRFSLFSALFASSDLGEKSTLSLRIIHGWNYFLQMFAEIIHLPKIFLPISLLCLLGAIVFRTYWRGYSHRLAPIFLLLSTIAIFLACTVFDGKFFLHFSEPLFVLLPIAAGITIGLALENKSTALSGLFILTIILINNWHYYLDLIVNGEKMYKIENHICSQAQKRRLKKIKIVVNGQANPEYLRYVCETYYEVKLGQKPVLDVTTDFKNKLRFQ